ncbi:MAG: ABC transporter permease [Terriglobia bacterium]
MSIRNVSAILGRSLRLGPRNSIFLFALSAPFLYTLIFQVLLGSVFRQEARLVVTGPGGKEIVAELKKAKGLLVTEARDRAALRSVLEDEKADVGYFFKERFPEDARTGQSVTVEAFISGSALAKNRVIAGAALAEAVRSVGPEPTKINFELVTIGEERSLTLLEMFMPLIVLVSILIGAFFVPAAMFIQEKENKTLAALLVSPVSLADILAAFGLFGAALALGLGLVVLAINVGLGQGLLLVPLALGSLLMAAWGLLAGLYFKDMNSLFANVKIFNIVNVAPAVFYFFPDWPQWIARIFPTYYIINPVFEMSIFGTEFSKIAWEIAVLGVLVILSVAAVLVAARRFQTRFA